MLDYYPKPGDVNDLEKEIWPGQDYSNPRVLDFSGIKDETTRSKELIPRNNIGRLPWHDIVFFIINKRVLE